MTDRTGPARRDRAVPGPTPDGDDRQEVVDGFRFDGTRCGCGATVITAVERCPECGRWDPPRGPVAAEGVLLARTSTETEDGTQRGFGIVQLDCGLRTIGVTRGEAALGAAVVAVGECAGVPVFAERGTTS